MKRFLYSSFVVLLLIGLPLFLMAATAPKPVTVRAYELRSFVIVGPTDTLLYDMLIPVDSIPKGRIVSVKRLSVKKRLPRSTDQTV